MCAAFLFRAPHSESHILEWRPFDAVKALHMPSVFAIQANQKIGCGKKSDVYVVLGRKREMCIYSHRREHWTLGAATIYWQREKPAEPDESIVRRVPAKNHIYCFSNNDRCARRHRHPTLVARQAKPRAQPNLCHRYIRVCDAEKNRRNR